MRVHGPNKVGGVVQTDATSLCYASVLKEQKKMLRTESRLAQRFDQFQTWHNNSQQHTTTCNVLSPKRCRNRFLKAHILPKCIALHARQI